MNELVKEAEYTACRADVKKIEERKGRSGIEMTAFLCIYNERMSLWPSISITNCIPSLHFIVRLNQCSRSRELTCCWMSVCVCACVFPLLFAYQRNWICKIIFFSCYPFAHWTANKKSFVAVYCLYFLRASIHILLCSLFLFHPPSYSFCCRFLPSKLTNTILFAHKLSKSE